MSPSRRANILIVDDVDQNLVALEAILEPLGQKLVRASSGVEALKRLLEIDVALILLDIQMPGLDGFETAEHIRRRERTRHVPIIFLTAIDTQREKVHRGYNTGAVDYLFKPYDPDTLRSKVAVFVELDRITRALRDSEERARQIVDTAHEAFIAMDVHGRVTDWNPEAARLFGWPKHEAIGREMAQTMISPEHRDTHRAGLSSFLATGEAPIIGRRIESEGVHRGGRRFPVELTIAPMRVQEGWAFNVFLHDISDRKGVQDQLARARDEALDASRLKSQFLANMSHEIRTPMNGVIGMTELLLDTELTDSQLDFATTVRSSAEALVTVIEDILDFSKIEAGKLELDPHEFDLRDAIEDVCHLLAARADDKRLEIRTSVADDVPDRVVADQGRLRQIMTNLIGNAVKFTDEGEVVVAVSVCDAGTEETNLLFEVSDTGIGMSPDKLDRVFESFSQADASTTRRFGGTGLGLAIARQLAELMGGEMWAVSDEGQGSTFSFRIGMGVDAPLRESPDLHGRRVLIVDDEEVNRTVLVKHLEAFGATPESAGGASEALEIMRAAAEAGAPFELVLLDFNMRAMNGIDLGRAIKADAALASAAMVLITSSGQERKASHTAGFAGYATKPVRRSRLSDLLARAMDPAERPSPEADAALELPVIATMQERPLVLVAEDNKVNQRVAVGLLEKRGYRVDVAMNGREAVDMCRRETYAAVFMDCQMPELDGYGATAAIRQLPGEERIPIIAMTANTMTGDRERCLAAGMDDYIGKPIRRDTLDGALARTLGDGRNATAATEPAADADAAATRSAHQASEVA